MTTLTLDLPELVSVCIPEVEHQYYGTYHFKQTENLSDIKSLNFNKLHNTTNFSKENYIQSSKVEQDIPRSEKLLEYVMKNDNQSLIQLLKETSSTTESETDCIDLNFTENSAGLLPIHYASSRGFLLVVKTLIEIGGADVNAVDKENESALYKASHNGHLEVMTYLISKGASVDIQDQEGWSSLHNCSSRGFKDCVELLLLKKCEIDVQSTTGFTPLMVACSKGYSDITLILLRNNANPLLKNKVGEYAYDLASQNEHAYICDVLETAEKMKNDNQPITHSTFYELIYEYQCTTMFTSKFSNQNLSKPDKQTFTNKLNQPKAKSQVQLPSKDWFWLSDWKLDLNHPLVDPETGWQYSRNLEDQVWQKKLPNSSLFGGNVGAVYRRRRWIRIRKLRRDFFDAESELTDADYLITAQNMFKNFFKDEDFISNELELDESFQMSQNIIQVLLDGIKDDVDLRRKKSAINMANNLLEKAEQFKVALENREKIRKSKGKETEVLLSPTTLQKQRDEMEAINVVDTEPTSSNMVKNRIHNMDEDFLERENESERYFEQSATNYSEKNGINFFSKGIMEKKEHSDGSDGKEKVLVKSKNREIPIKNLVVNNLNASSSAAGSNSNLTTSPLGMTPPTGWQLDSEVDDCTFCKLKFNFFFRRHHCRWCGKIFCNDCSSKKFIIKKAEDFTRVNLHEVTSDLFEDVVNNRTPERVCDSCYNILTNKDDDNDFFHEADDEDSLTRSIIRECPVCLKSFSDIGESSEDHLNQCLGKTKVEIKGNRYLVGDWDSSVSGDCCICFDEFSKGDKIARLNCLCVYHEECIKSWFRCSATCPVHV